jgi:hypothetical protein
MITGIGSLPHLDPVEAAFFVLDTTTIPYLPQLPNRHPAERMLPQWGDGLCGCGFVDSELGLQYGVPAGDRSAALVGYDTLLKMLPPDTEAVKTQATGPVTLAMAMLAVGHPGGEDLFDCLISQLRQRVNDHLASISERLPNTEIILMLDEPALSGLLARSFPMEVDTVRSLLESMVGGLEVRPGIHCCGPTDWNLVASVNPSWISWDIDALGPRFDAAHEAIAAATGTGTRIMWGVAPVSMGSPPRDLVSRLQRAMGTLVMGGADMASLVSSALYSPACGLAGLTEGQAEIVARTVHTVVGEMAELWTP